MTVPLLWAVSATLVYCAYRWGSAGVPLSSKGRILLLICIELTLFGSNMLYMQERFQVLGALSFLIGGVGLLACSVFVLDLKRDNQLGGEPSRTRCEAVATRLSRNFRQICQRTFG